MNMTSSFEIDKRKKGKKEKNGKQRQPNQVFTSTKSPAVNKIEEKSKKYLKIKPEKYQQWEANRRKRFNDVIEELRKELPNCNPCPKVEVIQTAIIFVKKQRNKYKPNASNAGETNQSNEDDILRGDSKFEKVRKQNVILMFILKEAGVKFEMDKENSDACCYFPVSCSMPDTHKVKVKKVRINLSSLNLDKENIFPSIQKTMTEKECQTDGKMLELYGNEQTNYRVPFSLTDPVVNNNEMVGVLNCKSFVTVTKPDCIPLPTSSDIYNGSGFASVQNFLTVPILPNASNVCDPCLINKKEASANISQGIFTKEHIIVEGDEKNGSVTVKLVPEILCQEKQFQLSDTDINKRSQSNCSSTVYIQGPTTVTEQSLIVHNIDSQLHCSQSKFSQIVDADHENIFKKKMLILKVHEGDDLANIHRSIIMPHIQDTNFQVTPSLSNTPIMSTGVTSVSKGIIQDHLSTPLLLHNTPIIPKVLCLYASPRLKRIAPKPVDQDIINQSGHTGTFDSQFFESLKKRHRPKPPFGSPNKKLKHSSEDTQQRKETCETSPNKPIAQNNYSVNSSASENRVLYSIKEIITTSLSERGNDDLDDIMSLPDDMPCVISETIQSNELEGSSVSERLVEMLCSMDEDERTCTFSTSPHSVTYKNLNNVSSVGTKNNASKATFDKELNGKNKFMENNKQKENKIEISKQSLVNASSSSEPEISSGNSNYSIMSLCVSSKTDEKTNTQESKIPFLKDDCWPRTSFQSASVDIQNKSVNKTKNNTCSTIKMTTSENEPVFNSTSNLKVTKNVDLDSKSTLVTTNLSVSSLISHSTSSSESTILKGLDLQPLLDMPGSALNNSCPSTISMIPPSLYLHPTVFPSPPLPPIGLPTLPLPTLSSTQHSTSVPTFSFSCNVSSTPTILTSSSNTSFESTRISSSIPSTSHTIPECIATKDISKLITVTSSACSENTEETNTDSLNSSSNINLGTIAQTPNPTFNTPTSTQSLKLPFTLALAPTMPMLSTIASTETTKSIFSNSTPKSVFSLAPMTSYAHPFPFCALSLSDAPTTFSFTLTRNPSSTSYCSSHAVTTSTSSNMGLKYGDINVSSTVEVEKGEYSTLSGDSVPQRDVSSSKLVATNNELTISTASKTSTTNTATTSSSSFNDPSKSSAILSFVTKNVNHKSLLSSSMQTQSSDGLPVVVHATIAPTITTNKNTIERMINNSAMETASLSASSAAVISSVSRSDNICTVTSSPNSGDIHRTLKKSTDSNCHLDNVKFIKSTSSLFANTKEVKKMTETNEFKLPLPPMSSYLIEESFPLLQSSKNLSNASSELENSSGLAEKEKTMEKISENILTKSVELGTHCFVSSSPLNKSSPISTASITSDIDSKNSCESSQITSLHPAETINTVLLSNPVCSITRMLGHAETTVKSTDNCRVNHQVQGSSSDRNCMLVHLPKIHQADASISLQSKPVGFSYNNQCALEKSLIISTNNKNENKETNLIASFSAIDSGKLNKSKEKNIVLVSEEQSFMLNSNINYTSLSGCQDTLGYNTIASTKASLLNVSASNSVSPKLLSVNDRFNNSQYNEQTNRTSESESSLVSKSMATTVYTENSISVALSSAKKDISTSQASDSGINNSTPRLSNVSHNLSSSSKNVGFSEAIQNKEYSVLSLASEINAKADNLILAKGSYINSNPTENGNCLTLVNSSTKIISDRVVVCDGINPAIDNKSNDRRNFQEARDIILNHESSNNLQTPSKGGVAVSAQVDNTQENAKSKTFSLQVNGSSNKDSSLFISQNIPQNNSSANFLQKQILHSDNLSESSCILETSDKGQSSNVQISQNITRSSSSSCAINQNPKENCTVADSSSVQTFYNIHTVMKNTQCQKETKVDDLLQKGKGSSPRSYSNETNSQSQLSSHEQEPQNHSNYSTTQQSQQMGPQLPVNKQSRGLVLSQQTVNAQVNPSNQSSPRSHMHQAQLQHQEPQQQFPVHAQHQVTQQLNSQQHQSLSRLQQHSQQQPQIPSSQQQATQHHVTQVQQLQPLPHQQQHQSQPLQQQYGMNLNQAQKQQLSNSNAANNHISQNVSHKDNCSQSIGIQQSNANGTSQQMIVQQQQILQQTHHHQIHANQQQHLSQDNSHLQSLNNFESPTIDASTERGSLKNQHSVQHHLSPMGSNSGYTQTFDYNPYYRKQPQSPRNDNRHQCYAYKQVQHFQQDILNDGSASASHALIQPPFLESNEETGMRGDEEPPSDHLSGFSVSHLVSPFNEPRKSILIGEKEQQATNVNEEKTTTKDASKKSNSRKGEKSRGSGGNKGNTHTGDSRRRSPARSIGSQHPNNTLTMWNSKQSTTKQGQNYSAEALISSQNYVRPTHRQPVNQNYHFIPNQMYQSSYSTQQMKNFVQNPSFGYSGHDRSGVCNTDYNFQLHSQASGTLPYGTNVPYMTPSYPYQNLPPTSTSVLGGDIMAGTHHPGTYTRLHDINTDHSNFSSNAAFQLTLDPQDMCGGSGLVGSSMTTMGVKVPTEPPFSICSSTSYPRLPPPKGTNGVLTSTAGNGLASSGKRSRYADANMMASGMGTPTNFLEGISHISLHSFTPPCDDSSIMHSNFLAGSSRHQSNFLLGADNFVPLNTSQYSGHSVNSGTSITSTPNSLNAVNGSSHCITMGPPVPSARTSAPPVPYGTTGHMSFNPLRMMDRQQMNAAPPVGPHLSSSLSNFNLTSIFPEIDGKNEESNSPMSSSSSRHGTLNHSDGGLNSIQTRHPSSSMGNRLDPLITSSELNKARSVTSQAETGHLSQTTTLNNSMNSIFPTSHQVGLLPSSTFSGLNFTSSEH